MKRLIFIFLISNIANAQTPLNDPHWQLVWQDNFDSFDTFKWVKANYGDHFGEPILMLEQNTDVYGGNLVIKVDNNPTNCPINPPPDPSNACGSCIPGIHMYTGGWVENTRAYNIQYGYIEAMIKFPMGTGLWPAFWTYFGTGVVENNAAEIDIAEIIGDLSSSWRTHLQGITDDLLSTTNIHLDYRLNEPDYFSAIMMSTYTSWHKYAIEWSPSKIIWYIDDYPVRLFPNHGIIDPVRVILGMGVQVDANKNPDPIVSSITFPKLMYVDYVKVYSLNEDCNDFINEMQYDFSTYNNIQKNFIKIGEGGGTNFLNSGDDIKLRASQFVEFSGDFYVPIGAALFVDANKNCTNDLGIQCTQKFNPCLFDFANYNNEIKREIDLGDDGCNLTISPTSNNLLFDATESSILYPGVTIIPSVGRFIELKIVSCPN